MKHTGPFCPRLSEYRTPLAAVTAKCGQIQKGIPRTLHDIA